MKLKLPLRVVGYTPVKIFDDEANVLAEFEYRDIKIAKEFVKRCNEHEQLKKDRAELVKGLYETRRKLGLHFSDRKSTQRERDADKYIDSLLKKLGVDYE